MSMKSFSSICRPVFVVFHLYLLGDAFFRWDGFKYYASLYDYIASFALVTIFWSVFSILTSLLIWLPFRAVEWLGSRTGMRIRMDQLLVFSICTLLLGSLVWKGKTVIWPDVMTSLQLKLIVLISVVLLSALSAWFVRDKTKQWMDEVNERVTPLVWLFGLSVACSVVLVAYHIFLGSEKTAVPNLEAYSAISGGDRPNVLMVTFDALSARNMSLYGYERPTTPFLDEWSKDATVFTRAEATSNYTAPTTASLMSGKYVWTHLRYNRMQGSKPVNMDTQSLPYLLRQHGYVNMMFIANIIASAENLGVQGSIHVAPNVTEFWKADNIQGKFNAMLVRLFADKFKIYNWLLREDFVTGMLIRKFETDESVTRFPPELAFNSFLNAIEKHREGPFFAWIHLDPPHYPYLPPAPFMGMFGPSGEMRTLKSQSEGKSVILDAFRKNDQPPHQLDVLRARYDEFIRYSDKSFEDFIDRLKSKEFMEDTIIIFSTDHGEIFEHNSLLHGSSLYEPETNIPLIIKVPGEKDGRVITDTVSQVDIPATILDLAGIARPSWMEGRSLVPLMRGDALSTKPVLSMNLENNLMPPAPVSKGTIVVWEGGNKLKHFLEKDESLLFNLKEDPDEKHNLFNEKPVLGRRLLGYIKESLKEVNEKIAGGE